MISTNMNTTIPFPQANDFNKVITVLNTDESKLSDYSAMCIVLGDITSRQVDYYESACMYLGLMTKDKCFTTLGHSIRNMAGIEQTIALSRLIVSDVVFGTVYFYHKCLGVELDRDDVIGIMRRYVSFASEEMYNRRSSTVLSWVRWILDNEA